MSEQHDDDERSVPATSPRGQQSLVAGARVQALIPTSWAGIANLANVVFASGLAPSDLSSPQKVAMILMQGLELGFPPMASLQRIALIKGKTTIWGDAALALIYSRNVAEFIEERFEGEGDKLVAVCTTKRRGYPSAVERTFSVEDAIRADLWDSRPKVTKSWWNKAQGKREWSKEETPNDSSWYRFPRRMLQMRARGFCLRDVYPDILMGLYLREELDDGTRHEGPQEALLPPDPSKLKLLSTEETSEQVSEQKMEEADERIVQERPEPEASRGADEQPRNEEPRPAVEGDAAGSEESPLSPPENPGATAQEWIDRLNLMSDEQEIQNYCTDVDLWAHCEAGHFDDRTAALIEDALNRARTRAAQPAADDLPPNPNA